MTDKELLATIAEQFDLLDTDDATPWETVICDLLVKNNYLTIQYHRLANEETYSTYRIKPQRETA